MKYFKKVIHEDKELLKGLSLTKIARLTGMDRSNITRIRAGKTIVTKKTYDRIKVAVGNK